MVEIGARKTSARWILSDASALPIRTRSVDAIAAVECAAPSSRMSCRTRRIQACRARGGSDAGGSPRESRDAVVSPLFSRDRPGTAAAASDAWEFDHSDVSRRLFARRGSEDLLLGTKRSYFRSGTRAASSLVRFKFPRIDLGISAARECWNCEGIDRSSNAILIPVRLPESQRHSTLPMPPLPTA